MFPLNTIIAWSINIIMNKKYDNNNIIIASRAYFLQTLQWPQLIPAMAALSNVAPTLEASLRSPSIVHVVCLVCSCCWHCFAFSSSARKCVCPRDDMDVGVVAPSFRLLLRCLSVSLGLLGGSSFGSSDVWPRSRCVTLCWCIGF
jgi:hypothetical protein